MGRTFIERSAAVDWSLRFLRERHQQHHEIFVGTDVESFDRAESSVRRFNVQP
jgi:hypothetical protein